MEYENLYYIDDDFENMTSRRSLYYGIIEVEPFYFVNIEPHFFIIKYCKEVENQESSFGGVNDQVKAIKFHFSTPYLNSIYYNSSSNNVLKLLTFKHKISLFYKYYCRWKIK